MYVHTLATILNNEIITMGNDNAVSVAGKYYVCISKAWMLTCIHM